MFNRDTVSPAGAEPAGATQGAGAEPAGATRGAGAEPAGATGVTQSAAGDARFPDVGLYVDDSRAIAAVSHPVAAGPSLHIASLHSTVLQMHSDGTVSLGAGADPDADSFEQFCGRIGEAIDGVPAEDLVALSMLCLLTEVASSIDLGPSELAAAATFPSFWTAEQVSAVRTSMNDHGLARVALVSEGEAARAWADSMQATWQVSDPAIAAARGAAQLASQFPVDAVTEEIAVLAVPSKRSTRTPIILAAAFAALLTLGAGVTALLLNNSATTDVPTIESAQADAPAIVSTSAPTGPIDFPTAAPIVEPIAALPATTEPTTTTPPTTEPPTRERPREEPVAATIPELATRPVADKPAVVTPVEQPPVVEPEVATPTEETITESSEPTTPTPTPTETP